MVTLSFRKICLSQSYTISDACFILVSILCAFYKYPSHCFDIGYITDVLEDARVCSLHASKKQIDLDDVKLAVERKLDHSFTSPPPREVKNANSLLQLILSFKWLRAVVRMNGEFHCLNCTFQTFILQFVFSCCFLKGFICSFVVIGICSVLTKGIHFCLIYYFCKVCWLRIISQRLC